MNECIMCDVRNLHLIPLTLMCVRTRSIAIFRSMFMPYRQSEVYVRTSFFFFFFFRYYNLLLLWLLLAFLIIIDFIFVFDFYIISFHFASSSVVPTQSARNKKNLKNIMLSNTYIRAGSGIFFFLCVSLCVFSLCTSNTHKHAYAYTHTHAHTQCNA